MADEEKQQPQAETPAESNIDYKDAWMRARADYENLKKEMSAKQQEWVSFANAGLLMDLLPVMQYFKQAVQFIPQDQQSVNWVQGIKHIQKMLEEFMEKNHIRLIDQTGCAFDAARHEAVGKRKQEGTEPDTVLEIATPGYELNGKVLQPAKVIVSE
jgi:molecular chaperone GrpE